MTPDDERYFERMEERLDEAFDRAERARSRGADPTTEVEIPVARDMADRVENILGIDGVAERVRELDGRMSREEAALALVTDFVEGTVGDYDTDAGKIEGAVRTAVALLTEGVVAAPIEGIDRVEVLANDDGTEFVNVYYAGPIRSAGGTAQALSVLVADYARSLLGIDEFKPRDDEVERYAEEVGLYDSETGLQYTPKDKETKFIAEHMPIMLDGEATGDEEVSGFRDLERVDTNSARGGMCLVLAEGIALKAPKIQRYTRDLEEVAWPWLQDLIDGTIGNDDDADEDEADTEGGDEAADEDGAADEDEPSGPPRVEPSTKFLRDLIAGRPVFGHPSEAGGFRLRYGRARNHGFATAGVHPATMHLVDDFLATGTQIKTERPGKAAGVVPVDTIEGPTVRLANGEVRRIDDPAEALTVRNGVEEILDLGEYLVNYGEFVENNHPLAPASYTVEWWVKEFEGSGADVQALRDDPRVDLADPSVDEALRWATEFDCPLHPAYTYLWHDVSVDAVDELAAAVAGGDVVAVESDGGVGMTPDRAGEAGADALLVETTGDVRRTLEALLVEHVATDDGLRIADWRPLARSLGVTADTDLDREWTLDDLSTAAREYADGENAVRAVNEVAPFTVRERAPTRIGNRMGRPEKSERRDLSPAVHTLYPIGEAGGSQRDVGGAARARTDDGRGVVNVQVGRRACPDCGATTHRTQCRNCGGHTEPVYECESCEQVIEPDESGRVHCERCDRDVTSAEWRRLDIGERYQEALDAVGEREAAFEILKGVKGLTSANKTPEPMEKGVLRAKHDVSAFKDGTVRYDMTDLPVTAVRPEELDVTADDFRELGYETDVDGDPLRFDDQLVELKVQDIVLSDGAAEHLLKTADFVDDLLTEFYDLPPFYEVEERQDLVGELVFGMAPHTSAAVVGRVVGFTSAAVGYAHPYFHAAKRRNCFHPETKVWYRDEDGAWHHERIERLVEERLEDPETDDFGTLVQELDGDVHVPSIDDDGEQVLKPVDAVSKHRAPDHLVEIETRSGRAVTVTPDHEVQVFDGGEVESKRASKVADDDQLIKPSHLDTVSPADEPQRIDLLAELLRRDIINGDRLTIRGIAKSELYDLFTESLSHRWEGTFYPLKSTAEYLGLSKKALSNYVYRESIPVQLLDRLFESTDALLSAVPDDVKLGVKRDRVQMDRFVELNGRVATLLGYYAAEGFARAQETPKGTIHQTTVCGTESEAREFFMETFRSEFGVEPYRENEAKVTVSGRLPRAFFDTVLNAGVYAESKRVPQHIFDSSNRIAAAYLRGYFSGDGSVDSTGTTVSASTVSNELKEDIVALLTRFGIEARIRHVEPVLLQDQFPEHYNDNDMSMSKPAYVVHLAGERSVRFSEQIGFHLSRKDEMLRQNVAERSSKEEYARCFDGGNDEYLIDPVESTSISTSNVDSVYCLTVADTHTLITNDLSNCQCDGDEDCVMLLMDGLLNFSQQFLPDQRGGRMDAPLVMSSRIDPTEIDDEAHNMDVVREYPLDFYEATREMADPEDVDVEIAEDSLETETEYHGFDHTHDTSNIALGPDLSAYKTLGSMMEKMDAQLNLARKLRAVDETDVAERVIEYHFLPDLIGNLRAFSRQETRCLDCGESYRRMPLSGDCRECGGRVNLTVHEGSVNKYMDTAIQVAEEFDCRPYTKQRLEVLEKSLESVFEDDHNKPSRLDDFM
jgi:DNA polymerase II large subunit